ncbi:MAG: fibronectin type III domain-containing protein [Saprospiraceae bacterium]
MNCRNIEFKISTVVVQSFFRYFGKGMISALLVLCGYFQIYAKADRFRATWRQDPSTSISIGWNQSAGFNPVFYYDIRDQGLNPDKYSFRKEPDIVHDFKGMKNTFVRLVDLLPNTTYYFIIKDSDGVSRKMSFQTAPNSPETRISIIAGGDSRNMREARIRANKLVGKMRPFCVMFGGDMSDSNTAIEWKEWFDDWQYTSTSEGRLTPVLPSMGNHEEVPETLINLFDVNAPNLYYALTFGGSLFRVYTLNSFEAPGGDQKTWLKNDLEAHNDDLFKITQYHLPIRPHTLGKEMNQEEYLNWTPLFTKFGMRLAIECDAHVAKYTFPLRPSNSSESIEGFVRDDQFGTVYIGEGGWGAPLRQANRNRTWTRNSESFNHFHWLFIDKDKIEVRTIKTDCVDKVVGSPTRNPFEILKGLEIWKPSNGDIVTIPKLNTSGISTPVVDADENVNIESLTKISAEYGNLELSFNLPDPGDVKVRVLNLRLGEIYTMVIPKLPAGKNAEIIRFDKVPPGRYVVALRSNRKLVGRFLVVKKS